MVIEREKQFNLEPVCAKCAEKGPYIHVSLLDYSSNEGETILINISLHIAFRNLEGTV